MKKVKLMLLSLTVLAVVGGALAFNTKGNLKYCTAPIDEETGLCPQKCPTAILNAKVDVTQPFVCTTITNGTATPCSASGVITDCSPVSASVQVGADN